MQPVEHAAGCGFLRQQLVAPIGPERRTVDHIDLRAPMMAARARQRRPTQDCLDDLRFAQARIVECGALRVVKRALAAELLVPDAQLRLEIAKAARHRDIDAFARRGFAHLQERINRVAMQRSFQLVELTHMRARAAGKFQGVEHVRAY